MRWLLLALALMAEPLAAANAECICSCVEGKNVPLCRYANELPSICPPRTCPFAPSAIRPIAPLTTPPLGASTCTQQQVLNPYTGQYEWRQVCQ
jgi:hypothetical protein